MFERQVSFQFKIYTLDIKSKANHMMLLSLSFLITRHVKGTLSLSLSLSLSLMSLSGPMESSIISASLMTSALALDVVYALFFVVVLRLAQMREIFSPTALSPHPLRTPPELLRRHACRTADAGRSLFTLVWVHVAPSKRSSRIKILFLSNVICTIFLYYIILLFYKL